MAISDPLEELAPLPGETTGKKGPCGCGGRSGSSSLGDYETLVEPQALIDELQSALTLDSQSSELALAGMEADLALLRDLAPTDAAGNECVGLQDVIALAERYPGLKITLSF